jgi:hypothetical protein
MEILWSSYLPCFDVENITSMKDRETAVIKVCKWKGVEMPCSAVFKMFPTDMGMCCSFNMEAADEIFNAGFYSNVIMKLQTESADGAFRKPSSQGNISSRKAC